MSFAPCEIERNAPLTLFERFCGALAAVSPFVGIIAVSLFCTAGCVSADRQSDSSPASVSTQSAFPEVEHWWK